LAESLKSNASGRYSKTMPKDPPRKNGTCIGKLTYKNPRIILGFRSVESPSKNGGKGKVKLKGGKLTKPK